MIYRTKWVVFIVIALATAVRGQVVLETTDDLKRIDVEEHLGDTIPLDLTFVDEDSQTVELGSFFNQGKPVLLVLGYYECPMLCNLVFNGLVDGMKPLSLTPGDDFQIVTVSIDSAETPQLATAKKANYVQQLGKQIDPSSWEFLVGDEGQIERLAGAVGFKYFYDKKRDEYAHPAVIFLLTEQGVISRYLYGIEFKTSDLKLGLLEASQGKLGSTVDKIILYCFHYDPDAEGYVVVAGNVMKLGGVATLAALVIFLSILWVGERRKRHKAAQNSDESEKVKVS
jgi:protein SCO1/2